ncbi:MAG TPA: serine hydrolase domain-containing protein [Candidatus Angelobacter sp.]|nr:serine hydrolase domain-containing protein [Candidatus Angelobacter sp.]
MSPAFDRQDEQFHRAFDVLRSGIAQRAFPGAAIAIAHQGKLIACKGFGHFTYDPASPLIGPETVYDLASVTKVVATTAACMILYERGVFRLDQPLIELLPPFGCSDKRRHRVTVRMLLAHSSGLPAYIKLFQTSHNKDELVRQALEVPLTTDPGCKAEYSDIGFILLGEALKRVMGEPLDDFCQREVFSRLSLPTMVFNPPKAWEPLIPPTEDDQNFRHRILHGEVNDENAFVMGGVAGHAGCFSSAADVSVFAQCMLQGSHVPAGVAREWAEGGTALVKPETVAIFTRREDFPSGTSRALGWDTPSQPSQSGKYFSSRSYGHLGYTGTSLWIDPDRQLSVTLLTNRTWPDRGSQLIKQIRPAFHDAIIEAL